MTFTDTPAERFSYAFEKLTELGSYHSSPSGDMPVEVCVWAAIGDDPRRENLSRGVRSLGFFARIKATEDKPDQLHYLGLYEGPNCEIFAYDRHGECVVTGSGSTNNIIRKAGTIPLADQNLAVLSGLVAVELGIAEIQAKHALSSGANTNHSVAA